MKLINILAIGICATCLLIVCEKDNRGASTATKHDLQPQPYYQSPPQPIYPQQPTYPSYLSHSSRKFMGYSCSDDCSGHGAGYEWAEENDIDDPDDCDGNSDSFIEGCQAYAEEKQAELRNDTDDD